MVFRFQQNKIDKKSVFKIISRVWNYLYWPKTLYFVFFCLFFFIRIFLGGENLNKNTFPALHIMKDHSNVLVCAMILTFTVITLFNIKITHYAWSEWWLTEQKWLLSMYFRVRSCCVTYSKICISPQKLNDWQTAVMTYKWHTYICT